MYYTARWKVNKSLRIGLAISDSPLGPFIDISNQPLFDFAYAVIDAHVFMDDDGQAYLYYSRDCSENIVGTNHESHTYGIALSEDLHSVVGEPVLLTKPEQDWEIQSGDYRWNEGPYVLKHQDTYYLMYSSNYYASREYSIGYATSKHPLGPYIKYEYNPILATKSDWKEISGPGHHSITTSIDGKELWMVYHTHTVAQIGGGNHNTGKELYYLIDGDASFHSQTKTLRIKDKQILKLTWPKEQLIIGLRLYGDIEEGADLTKIHIESEQEAYFEGFTMDHTIGGAMEAYFEPISCNEITIYFDEGCSAIELKEIEIFTENLASSSVDESAN